MVKFVANFLFILILFIMATALPLSMDIFSLDLSPVIVNEPTDQDKTFQLTQYTLEVASVDKKNIHIKVSTSKGIVDDYWEDNLTLKAIGAKGENFVFKELSLESAPDMPNTFILNLGVLLKEKPSDYYTLTFETDPSVDNIKINGTNEMAYAHLNPNLKYTYSIPELQKPLSRIVFFYPSEDLTQLIPITKDLNVDSNYWRLLYDYHSSKVPEGLGLKSPTLVLPSPNIQLKDKIAYIYHYEADLKGREKEVALSHEAAAKTYLANSTFKAVQFLYNGTSRSNFGEVDWSKPYLREDTPKVYFGFEAPNNRLLLEPLTLKTLEVPVNENGLKTIWDTLIFKNKDVTYSSKWLALMPSDLTLNGLKLEQGILSLDFTKSLEAFAKDSPELFKAFVDCVVLSYRSIPTISGLKFTVDGQPATVTEIKDVIQTLPVINYTSS